MYQSESKRFLIVLVGLIEILIFSGTILGWTSLRLMLKNEGIYEYLCQTNPSSNSTKIQESRGTNSRNTTLSTLVFSSKKPTPITTTTTTTPSPMILSEDSELIVMTTESSIPLSPTKRTITDGKNFLVKINFTLIDDPTQSNGRISDAKTNPIVPVAKTSRSMVIPFETRGSFNQSFIYHLLNDSSLILRSNQNDQIKIDLVKDPSTPTLFEEYVNLFVKENLLQSSAIETNQGCKEQELQLNLAFSIGSFCMGAAAFIWGFLLEKWGLRFVRLMIKDWILFPALLIMSLSGVPIRIANMQISNLYPQRRSTIISVYSGAFSASSIIYVALQFLYSQYGFSFFAVNFILVILSLLTIPFTLFVLPKDRVRDGQITSAVENDVSKKQSNIVDNNEKKMSNREDGFLRNQSDSSMTLSSDSLFQKKMLRRAKHQILLQNFRPVSSPLMIRKKESEVSYINEAFESNDEESLKQASTLNRSDLIVSVDGGGLQHTKQQSVLTRNLNHNHLPNRSREQSTPEPIKSTPPLSITLKSFPYNLHQLWFSWMITYMMMYVGSLDLWTKRVTDDPKDQRIFANIYGLVQVLALIVAPLAGLLMDLQLSKANQIVDPLEKRIRQAQSGFWPLFITSMSLLICVLCHYFDRQEFVYASIVFMTIYRSFLLAVGSAFLRIRFHANHFNQLLGIMSSVSAVISLLQIPLYAWEKSSDSNVLYVNLLNTLIALLVMSNPLYLLIRPLQKYLIQNEMEQMEKNF
ncbi:Major Facilitator-like protein 2 [Sarcoptes scabiei]|uniref:Major Facilitator-like protein 2 n=1 Tax=Sarcoptes scabiei TaxID=52283 RepID=A0A131ZUG3_SARSC|nr:Major Facilitator-like protein 2 [Sarcoptes scabiei]